LTCSKEEREQRRGPQRETENPLRQIDQRHAGEEEEHVDQRDVENEHDELGPAR